MPEKTTNIEQDIAEFTQTIGILIRRVRLEASGLGLSLTESSVLRRLQKEGPTTTAALARAESVKPQSMGSTIAELEERGLVQRSPHPTDGRQMIISITEQGHALRESMVKVKLAWLTGEMSKLSEEELNTVFEAGQILKRMMVQS